MTLRLPATLVYHEYAGLQDQQVPELEVVQPKYTFRCTICFEDQSSDNGMHIEQCGHRFCKGCIHTYLSSALSQRRYPIPCPLCTIASNSERASGMSSSSCFGRLFDYQNLAVISQVLAEQIGITEEERGIWFELDMAMFSVLLHCRKYAMAIRSYCNLQLRTDVTDLPLWTDKNIRRHSFYHAHSQIAIICGVKIVSKV
jgi:hypothetical protein